MRRPSSPPHGRCGCSFRKAGSPGGGAEKGGWGLVVPSLLLYLDRFSGLICRWAVSGAELPQATQQQILVVGNLPAAQGRHKAAQNAGEHQCVQGQPSSCSMRWARPSVIAAALYRAPLRRLSSVRPQITRSGIRRRISGSWAVPESSASSPSRTGRRPAQWGSEPVRWKRGRDEWHCPQAGAPQRWRQRVRLLRYTVWFFPYDFPLLPPRRGGCSAFLFDFYRLGQRVTGPLRGR